MRTEFTHLEFNAFIFFTFSLTVPNRFVHFGILRCKYNKMNGRFADYRRVWQM